MFSSAVALKTLLQSKSHLSVRVLRVHVPGAVLSVSLSGVQFHHSWLIILISRWQVAIPFPSDS